MNRLLGFALALMFFALAPAFAGSYPFEVVPFDYTIGSGWASVPNTTDHHILLNDEYPCSDDTWVEINTIYYDVLHMPHYPAAPHYTGDLGVEVTFRYESNVPIEVTLVGGDYFPWITVDQWELPPTGGYIEDVEHWSAFSPNQADVVYGYRVIFKALCQTPWRFSSSSKPGTCSAKVYSIKNVQFQLDP